MTVVERLTALQQRQKTQLLQEPAPDDPLWCLAQRVVSGPHFARSPLLSKFLLFVVAETLDGRGAEITEHQIGVQVFDRPADYRTLEDNIVRNYARQLRKRLAEHFAEQGSTEPIRIDIPVGGYVPVFVPAVEEAGREEVAKLASVAAVQDSTAKPALAIAEQTPARRWNLRMAAIVLALLIHSVALVTATWFLATYEAKRGSATEPTQESAYVLWVAMFGGSANCYVVPSDAGFNLLEDLSHRPLPLAQYIAGSYRNLVLGGVDAHSAEDLRSQQLTPYVDLQIAAEFARLAEVHPHRVSLRFPRDLRLDDLKNANAVIIGSVSSNPWAALAETSANFRIADRPGMNGAE